MAGKNICINCGFRMMPYLSAKDRLNTKTRFYQYFRCPNCKLVALSEKKREANNNFITFNVSEPGFINRIIYNIVFKRIKNLAIRGVRVLDFGSGTGHFASYLKQKGYEVDCVEIDKPSADYAKKKYGLKVYGDIPHKKYDLIIMNNSIEHLINPAETLEKAFKSLNNGGILYVSLPLIDGIQARIKKEKWLHLDAPRHIFLFGKENLKHFIESKGFKMVKEFRFEPNIEPAGWYYSVNSKKFPKSDYIAFAMITPLAWILSMMGLNSTGAFAFKK